MLSVASIWKLARWSSLAAMSAADSISLDQQPAIPDGIASR